MCGIVGLLGRRSGAMEEYLAAAVSALRHRGPDSDGFHLSEGIALGHTRLAIRDTSAAGAQPMYSQDRRYVIVYNGEIYNTAELSLALEQKGVSLQGTSDTEVLLKCFIQFGQEFFERINGIYAFAIADMLTGEITLARDPLGIKPLYFSEGSFGVAFSSEIKALLAIAPIERAIDSDAAQLYLTYLWCPGEQTLLKNVRKLEPGTLLVVKSGQVKSRKKFATLPAYAPRRDWTADQCARELQVQLDAAVDRQMVSDAPVGAFLSGGVDSSAIVASAISKTPDLKCYTIVAGFSGQAEANDDLPFARSVARELKAKLIEVEVTPEDIMDNIRSMMHDLEEPLADPAALNLKLISARARADGIKVMLSGTGGDDVFSGYRRHRVLAANDLVERVPSALRSLVSSISQSAMVRRLGGRRITKAFQNLGKDENQRLAGLFQWTDLGLVESLLHKDFSQATEKSSDPLLAYLLAMEDMPILEKCLELEKRFFIGDHNLIYTDKMGMSQGVEIRVPFLDKQLLEFASTIPSEWKMRRGNPKWMLKKSQQDRLPSSVLNRPKTGFGVPLRQWMAGSLKPMVEDLLGANAIKQRGIFDYEAVQKLQNDTDLNGVDGHYSLFSMMCIEMWAREFID